jgi:von Willebrand factor A domain-containing protein 7
MKRQLKIAMAVTVTLASVSVVYAFKPAIHADISREQLTSVSKTVSGKTYMFTDKAIAEILKANTDTDCVSCQADSDKHFDDENFTGGSDRILNLKNKIVSELSGSSPDGPAARKDLGTALHTVQDFYAHSTRVELGQGSFDNLLGTSTFAGPAIGVQTCPNDKAVLAGDGLSQATSGYFRGPTFCDTLRVPKGKCIHGINGVCAGINKDEPGRPNFQAARDLAGTATMRFINLILNDPAITNNAKAVKALMGISSTLGMVVDTTGSMSDIQSQVKNQIASIVNSVVGTDDEPEQYLLAPFNDPFTGPVTVTSDAATFLSQVNSLTATGGGDCPELAMQGLSDAISNADDDSTLFLFTDASAKDSALAGSVAADANKKRITINFGLFGSCSPIDPGFIRVAAETGGQIFFLARTEAGSLFSLVRPQVGLAPDAILHSTGTLAASSRDFQFPVDSTLTSLTVAAFAESLSSVSLTRPDGSVVVSTDPDANITVLTTATIFNMTAPQVGMWHAHIQGTGSYSVAALGKSTLALQSQIIHFQDFSFVTLTGRTAHAGYFPIPGQPFIADSQTVMAQLMGPASNTSFSFVSEAGDLLQIVTLNTGDPNAASTDFVGTVALPTLPFRVMATGTDSKGAAFQRIFVPLFRPQAVKVTPTTLVNTIAAGRSSMFTYEVKNGGPDATFQVTTTDTAHFVSGSAPSTLTLANGATGVVTVTLNVPASAPLGSFDSVTVVATSSTDNTVNNSAVQDLEVSAANRPPDTSQAQPSISSLWPPNHKLVPISILGVTDPDGDPVTIMITAITQNEPTTGLGGGDTCPDATGIGSSSATLRAERDGNGGGRLYTIFFTATDGRGGATPGMVNVVVPHDQGIPPSPGGGSFDSTSCPI